MQLPNFFWSFFISRIQLETRLRLGLISVPATVVVNYDGKHGVGAASPFLQTTSVFGVQLDARLMAIALEHHCPSTCTKWYCLATYAWVACPGMGGTWIFEL